MAEQSGIVPRIVLAFEGYDPSFAIEKLIRNILQEVPPKFLRGLHSIVLTNVGALSTQQRKRKSPIRGHRTVPLGEALGFYSEEWQGQPACITLLLDNIEKQMPGVFWRMAYFRATAVSDVLLHEIGHHIHRVHRPEFAGPEDVAERWSKKLSAKFIASRYWYLFPIAVPIVLFRGLWKDASRLLKRIKQKKQKY